MRRWHLSAFAFLPPLLIGLPACSSSSGQGGGPPTPDASAASDARAEASPEASPSEESGAGDAGPSADASENDAAGDAAGPSCASTEAGCVACGDSGACGAPSVCCGATESSAVCQPPQCNQSISVACDGTEDCPGSVERCCVGFDVVQGATSAYASKCGTCTIATAVGGNAAHGSTIACHASADCANVYEGDPSTPDPSQPDNHCCFPPGARTGICADALVESRLTQDGATCL